MKTAPQVKRRIIPSVHALAGIALSIQSICFFKDGSCSVRFLRWNTEDGKSETVTVPKNERGAVLAVAVNGLGKFSSGIVFDPSRF